MFEDKRVTTIDSRDIIPSEKRKKKTQKTHSPGAFEIPSQTKAKTAAVYAHGTVTSSEPSLSANNAGVMRPTKHPALSTGRG